MDALTFSKFRLKPRVLCIIRYVVRGVVWYEWFPCSPTSTDSIYTIKLVLDQWIYDETYVKKIGLKIGPILIWLWLSGMHLCWFLTWMHKLGPLSHMRLRARDCCTSSTLIGGKDGAGPSSLLHTTLEGPTEYVNARWWMWSLHGSYMASNESCFMTTWIIEKNRLLEVGLTQNWEPTAHWMLATFDLFYFIMCEDPHE